MIGIGTDLSSDQRKNNGQNRQEALLATTEALAVLSETYSLMVSPLILVNTIYSIVDCFISANNVVMMDIQKAMITAVNYGQASAMAWLYFVPIVVVILVVGAIVSRHVFYYD